MKTFAVGCVWAAGCLSFAGVTPLAVAEVNRNAGVSHFGGMGLDLDWYCEQVYGEDSEVVSVNDTATGWRCVKGSELVGLSVNHACRLHYGNTATAYVGPGGRATDWYCILGLNLTWHCQNKYGGSARAVKLFPNDNDSWKCKVGTNYYGINMTAACRSHYGQNASARLGFREDSNAWHCQL